MDDWTKKNLDWFFKNIDPISDAYTEPVFAFLAYRHGHEHKLIAARILLSPLQEVAEDNVLKTGNFIGFKGKISSLGVNAKQLIDLLLDLKLPFFDDMLELIASDNFNGPSIYQVARGIHEEQSNTLDFRLSGSGFCEGFRLSDEDLWNLRASNPPYFNLQDIMNELGLGTGYGFEILALAPVAIASSSRIDGTKATIQINAAKGLDESQINLGVVIHGRQAPLERKNLQNTDISWKDLEENPAVKVGEVTLTVPKASLLHCYANFGNRCYNTYWVTDPTTTQNHLRAIVESFDADFRKTKQLLDQGRGGSNSEGHENAMATMMWMLGFSPLNTSKLVEAPDLVGVDADGNIIVVECTLGDLKTKQGNKMKNLLDRAKLVTEALEKANASFFKCIPVVVSSKNAEDIKDDIAECERQGIVVYTRDDLEELFNITRSHPNSRQRFAELKSRIEEKTAQFEAEKRRVQEMERSMSDIKRALTNPGLSDP